MVLERSFIDLTLQREHARNVMVKLTSRSEARCPAQWENDLKRW